MKEKRMGSIEFYVIGNAKRALLSIGKIHGDEPYSSLGLRGAMEDADKDLGGIGYIVVPEANPTDSRKYEGVDINRDFGRFCLGKTRDLHTLIEKYKPVMIVDHHEDNCTGTSFRVLIENENRESMEARLAKRLVEYVCSEKGLEPFPKENVIGADWSVMEKLFDGVYYLGLGSTLTGYHGNGMIIEVPSKGLDGKTVAEIHKICDLFLKKELEQLAL